MGLNADFEIPVRCGWSVASGDAIWRGGVWSSSAITQIGSFVYQAKIKYWLLNMRIAVRTMTSNLDLEIWINLDYCRNTLNPVGKWHKLEYIILVNQNLDDGNWHISIVIFKYAFSTLEIICSLFSTTHLVDECFGVLTTSQIRSLNRLTGVYFEGS